MSTTTTDIEKEFLQELHEVRKEKRETTTVCIDHNTEGNDLLNQVITRFQRGKYGGKLSDIRQIKEDSSHVSFTEIQRTATFEVSEIEFIAVEDADSSPSSMRLTSEDEPAPYVNYAKQIVEDASVREGDILFLERAVSEIEADLNNLNQSSLSVANDYCVDINSITFAAIGPIINPYTYTPVVSVKAKIDYTLYVV